MSAGRPTDRLSFVCFVPASSPSLSALLTLLSLLPSLVANLTMAAAQKKVRNGEANRQGARGRANNGDAAHSTANTTRHSSQRRRSHPPFATHGARQHAAAHARSSAAPSCVRMSDGARAVGGGRRTGHSGCLTRVPRTQPASHADERRLAVDRLRTRELNDSFSRTTTRESTRDVQR